MKISQFTMQRRQAVFAAQIHPRHGGLFSYFLMYLFLAGAITASAGTMLHVMLKSQSAEQTQAAAIRDLVRLERELRTDFRTALKAEAAGSELILQTRNQSVVVYEIIDNVVKRTARAGQNEVKAVEHFRFPKGTHLTFLPAKNGEDSTPSGAVFRLVSAEPHQGVKAEVGESVEAIPGRTVEIFLTCSAKANQGDRDE